MVEQRLEIRGVSRRFGRLSVLAKVSATVGGGEVLPVRGRNGSGKSTLLRCLAGLLAPDAGEILAIEEGRELEPAGRRRRIGYVAPDLAFYEELTVGENLEFFTRLRRVPLAIADELLARVDLPPDRRAGALSSGMRQRLRWIFALLHRPRLLLLDEPFQNLDDPGEATARELLSEHLAAGGLAVIASPIPLDLPGNLDALVLDR
ncbi:MAG: ABC transporter ATP-binding protein [Acidobacteria bacterium]|nr:ABC transporter ATP-binding protein [Acidobacteriota bacterium]MCB9377764.1 ABC transporter ATP-binding protein [Holophagales bacterium]